MKVTKIPKFQVFHWNVSAFEIWKFAHLFNLRSIKDNKRAFFQFNHFQSTFEQFRSYNHWLQLSWNLLDCSLSSQLIKLENELFEVFDRFYDHIKYIYNSMSTTIPKHGVSSVRFQRKYVWKLTDWSLQCWSRRKHELRCWFQ